MSVFGMVSAVAGLVKVRYLIDKAIIDNMIFRAHYRITSALLFVSCIIVTANNLIGKSMYGVFDAQCVIKPDNTFRRLNTQHLRQINRILKIMERLIWKK